MLTQTKFDMTVAACQGAQERIKALNIKGPKRQADEALAYICGYAKALQATGHDISPLAGWIQFDLAFNGYKAIQEVLAA